MKSKNQKVKNTNMNSQQKVNNINELVVDILSNVLDEDNMKLVKQELENNQEKFQDIFNSNKQTKSNTKKIKDPNAPKRPKTSYIYFSLDKREEINKSNPELSTKDIMKKIGNLWKSLSDKEKEPYIKLSEQDKKRYTEELKNYTPPDNLYTEKPKKPRAKKALTSYIFFCQKNREIIKNDNPKLSPKDITKKLGNMWKSLSDKEKEPYIKLSEQDKKRYNEEKESLHDEDDVIENKTKSSKKSSSKNSGFILFCRKERENIKNNNPGMSPKEITKELNNTWKNMSEEEKNNFN
jgi:hypothetical protein